MFKKTVFLGALLCAAFALFMYSERCVRQKIYTLAFGSCLKQWAPQPIWKSVLTLKPHSFLFLGDNVYSDAGGGYENRPEPERIRTAYDELRSNTDYQHFITSSKKNRILLHATWDDHDYGRDDAGADYPFKIASKKFFMEFFGVMDTVIPAGQPGIYRTDTIQWRNRTIQILLLDTRSFRSPLKQTEATPAHPNACLGPNDDPEATILGEDQWRWLEREFSKPADLRIVASSIQLLPTEHCFEKWSNFPAERERFFELIRKTRANGVVIVSGDQHIGDISVLPKEVVGYPLYEVTSSGMNNAVGNQSPRKDEPNSLRAIPKMILENNFGVIQLVNDMSASKLNFQIRNEKGGILKEITIPISHLLPEVVKK